MCHNVWAYVVGLVGPKNGDGEASPSWERNHAWSAIKTPLPDVLPCQIGRSRSNDTSRKIGILASRLSRSLKVVRTDTDRLSMNSY